MNVKITVWAGLSPIYGREDHGYSTPVYKVSSSLELFDRLVRMRYHKKLVAIYLHVGRGKWKRYQRVAADLQHKIAGPVPVHVTPEKLLTIDALEMFAYEVWEVIEKYRDEPGVNQE